MNDPREILKAAGVECAEVDAAVYLLEPVDGCDQCAAYGMRCPDSWADESPVQIKTAILALARLVARLCVCGNCGSFNLDTDHCTAEEWGHCSVCSVDYCHFTPSRWTARGAQA